MNTNYRVVIYLISFLIALFIPVLIFWNKVEFNYLLFTNEWLKIGINNVLIVIIMKWAINHFEKITSIHREKRFINLNIKIPIIEIIDILKKYNEIKNSDVCIQNYYNDISLRKKYLIRCLKNILNVNIYQETNYTLFLKINNIIDIKLIENQFDEILISINETEFNKNEYVLNVVKKLEILIKVI
jgi:hypothetical protein